MVRYATGHFPWRSLRVLQFVIFATSVNSTVSLTQFIIPLSTFYVKEYSGGSLVEAGFMSGGIVGSYFLGRGLTGWIWAAAGKTLGYRPTFTLAIMVETVLTFLLGVCTNVWTCLIIRAVSGMFSPLSTLSLLVLKRLSRGFGEDVPVVAQTVSFVATAGQAAGFLIGGCLSYPVQNDIVDSTSLFSGEPYLLPIITVGTVQFIALLFFFLDFPDLCERQEDVKPQKRDAKEDSAVGKYAELAESGNTELQRSEGVMLSENQDQGNPVTERKERDVEENEEDLPAYLQCYELEAVEEYPAEASGPGAQSHRSIKPSKPLDSTRALPEAKKPSTARGHVVAQLISREERKESIDETQKEFHQIGRSEKTTHISFIEENFQSNCNAQPCQSLDDPFKRPPNASRKPLYWSSSILILSNLAGSWLEGAMVTWLPSVPSAGLSLLLVGVTLAGSVVGLWFLMWTMTLICRFARLYRAAVVHCAGLLVVAVVPVLLNRVRPEGVAWVLLVIAVEFSIKYFATFTAAFAELMVSDSVEIALRQENLLYGEMVSTLCKGLGYIGGALLFSLGATSQWADFCIPFLVAGSLIALTLFFLICSRSHFPRFGSTPYAM